MNLLSSGSDVMKWASGKMGPTVQTVDGLVIPERTKNDFEFQKALRAEVKAYSEAFQKARSLAKSQQLMWGSTIFSSHDVPDALGREKRTLPTSEQLLATARGCLLVAGCISTQRHKVLGMAELAMDKYTKGWAVRRKDYFNKKKDQKPLYDDKEGLAVIDALTHPDRDRLRDMTFTDILSKTLFDHMVFDRVVLEIRRTAGGKFDGYAHVDCMTIKPLVEPVMAKIKYEYAGLGMKDRRSAFEQVISDMERATNVKLFERDRQNNMRRNPDGSLKYKKYLQVESGQVVNSFSDEDLIVGISNPSGRISEYGYGISLVEEAVEGIVAWLTSFNTNRNMQTSGNFEGFLGLIGDWDREVVDQFREEIYARTSGVSNAGRIPIIGINDLGGGSTDIRWIQTRPTNREMMYDYWLSFITNLVCSGIFQIHPSELGMKELGTGGTSLSDKSNEPELSVKAVGHVTILKFLKNQVFTPLVEQINPNYEFHWVGIEREMSQADELQMRTQRVDKYVTINEARADEDLPPLDEIEELPPEIKTWLKAMGNVPLSLSGPLSSFLNNQQMMQQQQQQQAEGQDGQDEDEQRGPDEPPQQDDEEGKPKEEDDTEESGWGKKDNELNAYQRLQQKQPGGSQQPQQAQQPAQKSLKRRTIITIERK